MWSSVSETGSAPQGQYWIFLLCSGLRGGCMWCVWRETKRALLSIYKPCNTQDLAKSQTLHVPEHMDNSILMPLWVKVATKQPWTWRREPIIPKGWWCMNTPLVCLGAPGWVRAFLRQNPSHGFPGSILFLHCPKYRPMSLRHNQALSMSINRWSIRYNDQNMFCPLDNLGHAV